MTTGQELHKTTLVNQITSRSKKQLTRIHNHNGIEKTKFAISQTKAIHLQCICVLLVKKVTQRHLPDYVTIQHNTM